MTDYQLSTGSRVCAVTGKEFRPGERFYSALSAEGPNLVRRDYAKDQWKGRPEGAFAFWQAKMPDGKTPPRRPPIDDEVLAECFLQLDQNDGAFRYVLALLLMRRKRFRLDDTKTDRGREVLCLRCMRTGKKHEVADPGLTAESLDKAQTDLFKVLGWD